MTDHPLYPWAKTHLESFTTWDDDPVIHLLHGDPVRSAPLTHATPMTDVADAVGKLTKTFTCTEYSSTIVRHHLTLPPNIRGVAMVDQGMFESNARGAAPIKGRFLMASTPAGVPLSLIQPADPEEGPWPVDEELSPSLNPQVEVPEPIRFVEGLLANLASAVSLHSSGLDL